MSRPRECSHEERYKDGHCKVCTRERHREYHRNRRAAAKLKAAKEARGLTLDGLTGRPEFCDLV